MGGGTEHPVEGGESRGRRELAGREREKKTAGKQQPGVGGETEHQVGRDRGKAADWSGRRNEGLSWEGEKKIAVGKQWCAGLEEEQNVQWGGAGKKCESNGRGAREGRGRCSNGHVHCMHWVHPMLRLVLQDERHSTGVRHLHPGHQSR